MNIALAAILALAQQDAADQALKDFETAWRKAARDEGARANSITPLLMHKSEKILDSLLAKAEGERSNQVKESLIKAIREYKDKEKAVDFLYDQLEKNKKMPSVMQACFEGLGGAKPALTRPKVKEIHGYLINKYNRDMNIQVPAVKSLGGIRAKDSVEPLIERLKKAQQDMRDYIKGQNLPNCDGG